MKEILISINPEYVEKILSGKKAIEVRKSKPKYELPCKVYIYCTKNEKQYFNSIACSESLLMDSNSLGKVVAEFTLNKVEVIERDLNNWLPKNRYDICRKTLDNIYLSENELWEYGEGKNLYAWYIDNLVVYKKPKKLNGFVRRKQLKRPPLSWCYMN